MDDEDDDDGLDGDTLKTCDRCRFYREVMQGNGECRKFAPQPIKMRFGPRREPDDNYRPEWPTVHFADWCGEFEEHPLKISDSWR